MKSDDVEFSVNSVRWGLNRVSKPDSSFPRARARALSLSLILSRGKEIAYEDPIPLRLQQQLIALT